MRNNLDHTLGASMYRPSHKTRTGFALPIALLAIVVIGALIAGAFFSSSQEFKVGRNTLAEQRAFSGAEYGIGAVVDTMSATWLSGVTVGTTTTSVSSLTDSTPNATKRTYDTVRVTKLTATTNSTTALVTSTGQLVDGSARRRASMIVRFVYPRLTMPGALTVNGGLTIGGSSQISGYDSIPNGWTNCPPVNAGVPGIATQPGIVINTNGSGCAALSCVNAPVVQLQTPSAADTNTYFNYGSQTWTTLVAMATLPIPSSYSGNPTPTTRNGVCDRSSQDNWGEPWTSPTHIPVVACQNYFPIIYVNGSINMNAGTTRGQGILLVNGDIRLQGGFEFYGPVIARGEVVSRGHNAIFGTLASANVDLDGNDNSINGSPTIMYSNCSIVRAESAATTATPLKLRSWAEMP